VTCVTAFLIGIIALGVFMRLFYIVALYIGTRFNKRFFPKDGDHLNAGIIILLFVPILLVSIWFCATFLGFFILSLFK
jgi:heme/copper-type cytochrome/quinol oxidase subunit 2